MVNMYKYANFEVAVQHFSQCSPMIRETGVQSLVESYQNLKKMVIDTSLLNTQQYKVWIKGKMINPRKGVAPSPTPWCSSY